MTDTNLMIDLNNLSTGEKTELNKLGILTSENSIREYRRPELHFDRPPLPKEAVHAPDVLNEAFNYAKPSSFSRALKLELGGYRILIISGTASVNDQGKCEYPGDFRAQTWRTFRNIDNLLKAEEMSWHDVVRTTCYLRDMSRDYEDFNKIRTSFYSWHELDPLPASTGIQAILCWENLLVEIEAWAICKV
jgi:enamine deaminase RidA (YjgF/YER057c/UK114 family)